MGGFDGEGRTSSCERYDASRNQWKLVVASMHDVRSDASAVAAAGRIHVMGGFTGLDVLDTVEYYEPMTDTCTRRLGSVEKLDVRREGWSPLPSMSFPRSNFVAALLEGSIYAAAGFNGTATVSLVERYDIEARQWHRAVDLSITCSAATAYVYHSVLDARRWF
ncbi:hypothetical protein HPB48_003253 [Haemaphysalis longicornis]|uniref:Kelch repeat protein n=1 Tax=Haemaphysalis longicornis TaxID=44386 RepID=A0A9J6H2R7_HAELO|nr:hypothetical protein HPB48_003253 [Haemaphysalis longicornis]